MFSCWRYSRVKAFCCMWINCSIFKLVPQRFIIVSLLCDMEIMIAPEKLCFFSLDDEMIWRAASAYNNSRVEGILFFSTKHLNFKQKLKSPACSPFSWFTRYSTIADSSIFNCVYMWVPWVNCRPWKSFNAHNPGQDSPDSLQWWQTFLPLTIDVTDTRSCSVGIW